MNTVFVGMPGSGKTTISKAVADILGRDWADSDHRIIREQGMSIPDIFARHGEDYFRRLESDLIARLLDGDDLILSVGGGAVLRSFDLLKSSALVVYLKRSIEHIADTASMSDRPLVRDVSSLHRLYGERRHLYESIGDIEVENNGRPEQAALLAAERILSLERQGGKGLPGRSPH